MSSQAHLYLNICSVQSCSRGCNCQKASRVHLTTPQHPDIQPDSPVSIHHINRRHIRPAPATPDAQNMVGICCRSSKSTGGPASAPLPTPTCTKPTRSARAPCSRLRCQRLCLSLGPSLGTGTTRAQALHRYLLAPCVTSLT